MKIRLCFVLVLVLLLIFLTGFKSRIAEYEEQISQLKSEVGSLQEDIKEQQETIKELKNDNNNQYQSMIFELSCYTANIDECDDSPNMTANSTPVYRHRTIATDPSIIPMGSIIKITSDYEDINGIYVAEDTGSLINGYKIDMFVSSKEVAFEIGVREVEVEVLKYGWSG